MAEQRYKIYEQLGAGGNGAVFRAFDSQLKRWVAIKRLLTAVESTSEAPLVEELRREADTLAALRNPNIVTIFDVATDDEGLFMVMELLEGPDLADTISLAPLGYDDFKQLAEQTLEGLLAAHQHRVLHRDIKPENIKVERLPGGRFQSKIIDFGLARAGLTARKQTEDQAGSVLGSIYYMAPEQLSRKPTDVRTDLYALGCVLYEALAARKAFDGKSVNEVIDKHIDHDVLPLNQLCPHLPQWLTYWVMRLMAQKPDDRPASAQQAIEEFRAWEKLPPAPQMMTWMPQGYGYGPAPVMHGYTGQVPAGQHPTGSVPTHTTGYYMPMPHPTSAVPLAPQPMPEAIIYATAIPEAMSVAKAAPAKPTGSPARPKPQKPGTTAKLGAGKGGNAAKRPSHGIAADKKKFIFIGTGALVLVIVLAMAFSGGEKGGSTASTPPSATPPPQTGPGDSQEHLFPQDRPMPVVDHVRVAHYLARVGANSTKGAADSANPMVLSWTDVAGRGKNTPLRVFGEPSLAHAPKRGTWTAPDGILRGDRYALRFSQGEEPSCLVLKYGDKVEDQFPFGNGVAGYHRGLSLACVFQAEATRLPTRVLTLYSTSGGEMSVNVSQSKAIKVDFNGAEGRNSLSVPASDGTQPIFVSVVWDAQSKEIIVRTRDAMGCVLTAAGKLAGPATPLRDMSIGQVKSREGKSNAPSEAQFRGYLAEVAVYSAALRPDQMSLLSKDMGEHYMQKLKPKPLVERFTAKRPLTVDHKTFKLSANHNGGEVSRAVDGDTNSAWSTKTVQTPGMFLQIDMNSEQEVAGLVLDHASFVSDYPRGCKVEVSDDGKLWMGIMEKNDSTAPVTELIFPRPQKARFIKVTQTGNSATNHWQIFELLVLKP
jgi:hypothetical protein